MTNETAKKTLQELEEKITQKSAQIDALHYAFYLLQKDHDEAADMVATCPQNIYIEDWKRKAEKTAKDCELLKALDEQLYNELDALCNECEQIRQQAEKTPEFEVFVQWFCETQGMWFTYNESTLARFDNLTDAQKHAQNLEKQTKETATAGSYRVMIEQLEDGLTFNVEEHRFEVLEECEEIQVEEHYELRPVNHLKRGDFFRKLRNGKPTSRVYVFQGWDASEKKYLYYAFDDTCDWQYIKGSTVVAVGFTF